MKIGDTVRINELARPLYLRGATARITGYGKERWGGIFAETPFRSYDLWIESIPRNRRERARFRVGTKCINVDERILTIIES